MRSAIIVIEGDHILSLDTNEGKKQLCHIYNDISKELFGFGTTLLKVTFDNQLITFVARHRRSPRSAALEGEAPNLKYEVDFYMSSIYKKKLKERLEEELKLDMEAVLRDYDPHTQWAITNIIVRQA
ncbi:DUF2294 domain-containing protein [Paenibacillus sp. FSL H7-0331]|jgi:hypothetical protein|uniref:DUF2294 domain-containing protein n=1 Tax=Paenibacillus TaxID=44249 RepID=UPI0009701AF2|nr:DUF2294 domain-containing protein [Paenibacillus sp. FSL H7-0331]